MCWDLKCPVCPIIPPQGLETSPSECHSIGEELTPISSWAGCQGSGHILVPTGTQWVLIWSALFYLLPVHLVIKSSQQPYEVGTTRIPLHEDS